MSPSSDPKISLPSSSTLAMLAACSAGFCWGTGALVVNVLVAKHGFTPQNISLWRFVIGAVVLLAVFGWRLSWRQIRPVWPQLLMAGTAMAGYVLLWFLGIEQISAAIPTLIALCLPPVLVTLYALLRKRETLDGQLVIVLLTALLGTMLIVAQRGHAQHGATASQLIWGVLYALGSAFLYAGFTLISGSLSHQLGAGQATTCLTVIAAAVMGLAALYTPMHWPQSIAPQAWYLYLGIVTAAVALLAFSWGAARLTPTALTVATLIRTPHRRAASRPAARGAPQPTTVTGRRWAFVQYLAVGSAGGESPLAVRRLITFGNLLRSLCAILSDKIQSSFLHFIPTNHATRGLASSPSLIDRTTL